MWVVSIGISIVMLHFKDMRVMRSEVVEERADVLHLVSLKSLEYKIDWNDLYLGVRDKFPS